MPLIQAYLAIVLKEKHWHALKKKARNELGRGREVKHSRNLGLLTYIGDKKGN